VGLSRCGTVFPVSGGGGDGCAGGGVPLGAAAVRCARVNPSE